MKSRISLAVFCSALAILQCPSIFAQSNMDRLFRLDSHLANIQHDAKTKRETRGGLIVGLGILCIGGGAISFSLMTSEENKDIGQVLGSVLVGTGALFTGTGACILAFPKQYELLPRKFSLMPEVTEEDILKKIAKGEVNLQGLSNKARMDRLLGAGAYVVLGTAGLLFLPENTRLYSSATALGMGIITLLIESVPEREAKNYRKWDEGLALDTAQPEMLAFQLLPNGIEFSLKL